jgi:hypothetical protein
MIFKTFYLTTIVFALFGIIFLPYFKDPLVYWLYGYSLDLIRGSTAEAYMVNEITSPARLLLTYIVIAITFLCFIFSCIAMYKKIFVDYYLTPIVLVISFLLSLFYIFAMVLARITPTRSF